MKFFLPLAALFEHPNQLRVIVQHEVKCLNYPLRTWAHTLLAYTEPSYFNLPEIKNISFFQVMRVGRLYGAEKNLTSLIDAREIYLLYSLNIASITISMQQSLIARPSQRSATQLIENLHFYYFYLFPARDGSLLSRPTTRLHLFQSCHTKSRLRYSNPCMPHRQTLGNWYSNYMH